MVLENELGEIARSDPAVVLLRDFIADFASTSSDSASQPMRDLNRLNDCRALAAEIHRLHPIEISHADVFAKALDKAAESARQVASSD